jgi:hypothetical protein
VKIIVCGDVHGYFSILNNVINKQKPDIILQAGDFGYWPGHCDLRQLKNRATKIYFCPGNHENWDALDKITDYQIAPNVWYMPKGSVLSLEDGRNILFMGGADSIDKDWRTPGYDWFPQELINEVDMLKLPPIGTKVDIVISHTCPKEFDMKSTLPFTGKLEDPSRKYLSYILDTYKPKEWYFGHWHSFKEDTYKECKWTCLNENTASNWWRKI